MSLFLRMDTACQAEMALELRSVDPIIYIHLLEVCSRVASEWQPCADIESPIPRPPASQWIRADLVIPDDFVWRTDLSFDPVESVTKETGEVVICYRSGRTTMHVPADHVRVAVSPEKAISWNEQRVHMGEQTLRSVAEAYGVF